MGFVTSCEVPRRRGRDGLQDDGTNVPDLDAAGYRFFKATVRMRE